MVAEGKSRVGSEPRQKNNKKSTTEAIMCMKTNKTMTICPTKKRTFLKNGHHFKHNNTYLAETGGLFVTIRALRDESFDSKCRNLILRRCPKEQVMLS